MAARQIRGFSYHPAKISALLLLGVLLLGSSIQARARKVEALNPEAPAFMQIPKLLASCESQLDPESITRDFVDRQVNLKTHLTSGVFGYKKPITRIFVPSMTFDDAIIGKIKGIGAYEGRGLHRAVGRVANNPYETLVIVLSTPIEKAYIRYYLRLAFGNDQEKIAEAESRIRTVFLNDDSITPLTIKILQSPQHMEQIKLAAREVGQVGIAKYVSQTTSWESASRRKTDEFKHKMTNDMLAEGKSFIEIRQAIIDYEASVELRYQRLGAGRTEPVESPMVMDTTVSSLWEALLADELGFIPMEGNPGINARLETKSMTRKTAKAAGLKVPDGFEDVRTLEDLEDAVKMMIDAGHRKMMLKMDSATSGKGNAVLEIDRVPALGESFQDYLLDRLRPKGFGGDPAEFLRAYLRSGGIVEQFIPNIKLDENGNEVSPSIQADITPDGWVLIGTHDQHFFADEKGVFEGATYPANSKYRAQLVDMLNKLGPHLVNLGVLGRIAIDTVISVDPETGEETLWSGVDFNVRRGGTHPIDMIREFVPILNTRGAVDEEPGRLYTRISDGNGGKKKVALSYRHTDNFLHDALASFGGSEGAFLDWIYAMAENDSEFGAMLFERKQASGAVFHLVSGAENGKIGVTMVGHDDPRETEERFEVFKERLSALLDER